MRSHLDFTIKVLEELLHIPSPSGDTSKAIAYVEHMFREMGIETNLTTKNALIATLKGKVSEKNKVISAHVDTLGAMVKKIKSNGRLTLTQIGSYAWNVVDGENCTITTLDGKKYTGTILFEKTSVHNYGGAPKDDKRTDENMEIRIDEIVENKEDVELLGINVGDFVSFETRTVVTDSGFIKSRFLDDKACVALILGVAKYFIDNNIRPKYDIKFLISNYEEVGHGASYLPEGAFQMLAVDMASPGIGQNSDERAVTICAKDSSGPYDFQMRKRLIELSKEENINYKIDIYKYYGSDASAAVKAGNLVQHGLIGPGIDASHAYERTHNDGLLETMKLLKAYIKD